MKKISSKLLLLMLVLAMTLSLAACGIRRKTESTGTTNGNVTSENNQSGSNDSQSASDNNQSTPDSQSESDDQSATDGQSYQGTAGNKKNALYDSVADYVNSDAMQAALDSLKNTYANDVMSIDMVAEGENKLVYIFSYDTIEHTEGDGMAEALEAAIGSQDATFQQTANSIKPFVNNDEVIVEIRYIDMKGTVIFSKTYVSE